MDSYSVLEVVEAVFLEAEGAFFFEGAISSVSVCACVSIRINRSSKPSKGEVGGKKERTATAQELSKGKREKVETKECKI